MTEASIGLSPHSSDASHRASDVAAAQPMARAIAYLSVPVCFFGLIGNGILVCAFITKVKKTRFTVYFFNMAAADLVILIYHVIMLVLFLKAIPTSPHFLLRIDLMHEIGFCISLYLLTAISTERFLGLFFPLFYNRYRPLNFTTFVCIVLWGFATIMALVIHISCHVKSNPANPEAVLNCETARISYLIVNFVLFGPLLAFTTVGLFVRMKNLPAKTPVRLDKTIAAIVFLFFLLAASIKIVEILAYWFPKLHMSGFYACFPLMDAFQSSGKPFIYAYIGYSKNVNARDRTHVFLERALMDERYIADIPET